MRGPSEPEQVPLASQLPEGREQRDPDHGCLRVGKAARAPWPRALGELLKLLWARDLHLRTPPPRGLTVLRSR